MSKQEENNDNLSSVKAELEKPTDPLDKLKQPDKEPEVPKKKGILKKIKKMIKREDSAQEEPEEKINTNDLAGVKAEPKEPAVEEPQEKSTKNRKKKDAGSKKKVKKPEEDPEEIDTNTLSGVKAELARLTKWKERFERRREAERLAIQQLEEEDKKMLANRLRHIIQEFQTFDEPNRVYIVK